MSLGGGENLAIRVQLQGASETQGGLERTKDKVRGLRQEVDRTGFGFHRFDQKSRRARTGLIRLRAEAFMTNRGFRLMARGAATGGTALLVAAGIMGNQARKASSDLQESLSKTNTVFGRQSGGMQRWSIAAADGLGLSRRAALDAASSFAVYGDAAGLNERKLAVFSKGLVRAGSDLASFHNVSTDQALGAIRSGLAGETEPLKNLGVMMTEATLKNEALRQGLIKTTKTALTPGQKVLAAQAVIMRGLGPAQGDFARTSGGAANQQRILAANIENLKARMGNGLLPTWQRFLKFTNKLVPRIDRFILGMQTGRGAGGKLADMLKELGGRAKRTTMNIVRGFLDLYHAFKPARGESNKTVRTFRDLAAGIETTSRKFRQFTKWLRGGTDGATNLRRALKFVIRVGMLGVDMIKTTGKRWATAFRLMGRAGGALKRTIKGAWKGIQDGFGAMIDWIQGKWNKFARGLNASIDVVNKVPGVDIGHVGMLGQGGDKVVSSAPRPVIGGAAGTPLDVFGAADTPARRWRGGDVAPLGTLLGDTVARTSAAAGPRQIILQVDRREIARANVHESQWRAARA